MKKNFNKYLSFIYILPFILAFSMSVDFFLRSKMADVFIESQRTNIFIVNIRELEHSFKPLGKYFNNVKLLSKKNVFSIWNELEGINVLRFSFNKNIKTKVDRGDILFKVYFSYDSVYSLIFGLLIWLLLVLYIQKVIEKEKRHTFALIQSERAKQHADLIANLALMVSHDIRSPLTALHFVSSAIENLDSLKTEIIDESLSRIKKVINDLEQIKFLNYEDAAAKSDGSKFMTSSEKIINVLKSSVDYFNAAGKKTNSIKINLILPDKVTNKIVHCEINKLERIIINIMNNSLESIKKSGNINVKFSENPDGVAVSIEDDGAGIPQEIMGKIGQKGFTRNKSGGSGLGIHDAIENLKKWNGNYCINSKENFGTLNVIHLKGIS